MSIILTILLFGVIVFLHELGHFTVAKLSGVKVNEFAIGMGPKLRQIHRGETAYSLRLLPIGGYVSMEGEDESSDDSRAFDNRPALQKIAVLAAGAFMNLLLGFVLLIITLSMNGELITTTVGGLKDIPTQSSENLQVGDQIIRVDGMRVYTRTDIAWAFQRAEDHIFEMEVVRDGNVQVLPAVDLSVKESTDGSDAVHPTIQLLSEKVSVGSVLKHAFFETGSVIKMVWGSLIDLVTGKVGLNQLSGPVGVAGAVGEAAETSMASFLMLAAFITINVGIFNLLPIPALDGGRLLFLLIGLIIRRPIKKEIEGYVNFVGFSLLMLLMLVVTVKDIFNLF